MDENTQGKAMKPSIYNRKYARNACNPSRRTDTSVHYVTPWVVAYGGQDMALARTLPEAVEQLVTLQWGGVIPVPEGKTYDTPL